MLTMISQQDTGPLITHPCGDLGEYFLKITSECLYWHLLLNTDGIMLAINKLQIVCRFSVLVISENWKIKKLETLSMINSSGRSISENITYAV